ncbi:3-hydroxyacyl-ACP dehydratase FabZ family protein [Maribacter sp. 2210JD10-5]|uniref:3-hydroxyacyl-ACP dehydratase FabZ family protein n=1 Tax=Maribacter sp. 2210JD10-5 TaxID=3386272 RepID=UPI0039BC32F7
MEKEHYTNWIIETLPYEKPFLFVDELLKIDEEGAEGTYTFHENLDFYKGHFKNNPVTPGVILTECCAQIGLVCLGIFLLKNEPGIHKLQIGMSSSEMEFLRPVFPNEKIRVVSEKVFFRFGKLKCKVKMYNNNNDLVCRGTLSGMLKANSYG